VFRVIAVMFMKLLVPRYEKYEMLHTFDVIDDGEFVVTGVRNIEHSCLLWCITAFDECDSSVFRNWIVPLRNLHGSNVF